MYRFTLSRMLDANFRIAMLLLGGLFASPASAAPPALQTPGPVIYLADNLDEKDNLGWCIDTLGRGWSDRLQTHSCKPSGGDVQFAYIEQSRQIESVEFPGKCATLHGPAAAGVTFDLLDCSSTAVGQRFSYDAQSLTFRPEAEPALCITAGVESRAAGPFMSRDLLLAPCESTAAELRQWVIKRGN